MEIHKNIVPVLIGFSCVTPLSKVLLDKVIFDLLVNKFN
jgi:hypothetical protein